MHSYTIEVVGVGQPWFNVERVLPSDGTPLWVGGSFAARLLDEGACGMTVYMENGMDGFPIGDLGGFDFQKIIIRGPQFMSIIPRINHAISYGDAGYAIYIGSGAETFLPRANKIVRFVTVPWWKRVASWFGYEPWRAIFKRTEITTQHPHLALPKALNTPQVKAKYDAIGERILTALRTGVADPGVGLHTGALGCWMPMGYRDKGEVGGGGIEPYPGFDHSPLYRILSHDLTMEREAVSNCLLDGNPKVTPRDGYNSTSGPTIYTTLPEYSVTQPDGYYTRPRMLNTAACSYREELLAYQKRDDEHAVRTTAHSKVCALLYGDKAARITLEAKAADLWIGTHIVPTLATNDGSDHVGRGLAWTLNAMQACGAPWTVEPRRQITAELLRVQDTETGSYQAFDPHTDYYHTPSPYDMSGLGLESMSREYRAAHTLEDAYLGMGMAHEGYAYSADRVAKFLSYVQPRQWIAVTWPPDIQVGNVESFSCWGLWGVLGQRDAGWRRWMQYAVPPGAGQPCGPNVVQALVAAGNYEASAKAIEAAERKP